MLGLGLVFIKPADVHFLLLVRFGNRLRAGNSDAGAPPYILWLCAGLIPWFFMQDMLGPGLDVLHRYSYLVNKIKFPLSGISTIFSGATLIVELMLMVALFVIYFACGMPLDVVSFAGSILLVLMFLFWNTVSILFSQLSAMSNGREESHVCHVDAVLLAFRGAVRCQRYPYRLGSNHAGLQPYHLLRHGVSRSLLRQDVVLERSVSLRGFVVVFAITLLAALFVYKKFNEEVCDVL